MVALKNNVCLGFGTCFRTLRISGRKPMSSIRSASSSTRYSRSGSLAYPYWKWSSNRPGVAAMRSTPLRNAVSCGFMPTPPYTAAAFRSVWRASASKSAMIWSASSRVGAMTNARVVPRGFAMSSCMIGRRNAAVLPLPVAAHASRSRPFRAWGMASDWIGVGWVKPRSSMPRTRFGCRSSVEKDKGISGVMSARQAGRNIRLEKRRRVWCGGGPPEPGAQGRYPADFKGSAIRVPA